MGLVKVDHLERVSDPVSENSSFQGCQIAAVAKTDNWPIKKDMLIKKTLQSIRRIHENYGKNKRT